jgi:feruloyl esterase
MFLTDQHFIHHGIAIACLAFASASASTAMAETAPHAIAVASGSPACDDTIKATFKPDQNTQVVQVTYFQKGEALAIGAGRQGNTPTSTNNVCMVKIMVGPGNPGPAGAPSTSPGIGIEVWLPDRANWNGRFHAIGGGGWQGGSAGVADMVASSQAALVAGTEGAVSSTTDTGHSVPSGSFAMLPNGSINSRLWADFASRSVHEQAVKSKALTTLYYGRAPKYSYWDGGSTGGRQGLNLAQNHPEDFDGIIAMYPAINWTRFITSELYPQIVFQQDLAGRAPTKKQLDLVSNAAIAACDTIGGEHLGYIVAPSQCRYDAARDSHILCRAAGGVNSTEDCLSVKEARAINKIWYGMTSDGSVPEPSIDNGWITPISSGGKQNDRQRWFGLSRGTTLYLNFPGFEGLANPDHPFSIATHVVALEMQDSKIAEPFFVNASSNGQSKWKQMSYAQLSAAFDKGVALQAQFGNVNSDNPDLSAFEKRGGKLLTWHGLSDEVISPQGTINYYHDAARKMGGLDHLRSFYRLYLVPGLGHGTPNGTSNRNAVIPNFGPQQVYSLMTDWVEKMASPPSEVVLKTGQDTTSRGMPVCAYPDVITYVQGSPKTASSYKCK